MKAKNERDELRSKMIFEGQVLCWDVAVVHDLRYVMWSLSSRFESSPATERIMIQISILTGWLQ